MPLLITLALLASAAPASADDFQFSSPDARREMQAFGTCVADVSTEKAARTLAMDLHSESYRSAIRNLADRNSDCLRGRDVNKIRFNQLLFAGAMAERLMLRDQPPLNVRLARAAAQPAPPARGVVDRMAICVVRSAPDETARLFATEVASDAEAQALKALDVAINLCWPARRQLQTNPEGLRAMLATAAFRNVHPVALAEKK